VELDEIILAGTVWVVEGPLSSEAIVSRVSQEASDNTGNLLLSTGTMGEGRKEVAAATALQHRGFAAVLAPAFAWRFFRLCLNIGLPPLTLWEAGEIRMGDRLRVDIHGQVVKNLSAGTRYPIRDLSDLSVAILACGGMAGYVQALLTERAFSSPKAER
jgi:3-isopropylmalate dehydratase small subunit